MRTTSPTPSSRQARPGAARQAPIRRFARSARNGSAPPMAARRPSPATTPTSTARFTAAGTARSSAASAAAPCSGPHRAAWPRSAHADALGALEALALGLERGRDHDLGLLELLERLVASG